MLFEDELDFEVDLSELESLEELYNENSGPIDLDIDLSPITEESYNNVKASVEAKSENPKSVSEEENKSDNNTKSIAKQDDKKNEDKKTDEAKKDVLDKAAKQAATPNVSNQEEKKSDQPKKFDKKPIPSTLDNQNSQHRSSQYNKQYSPYPNRQYNSNNSMNYYGMQQPHMFMPNYVAMNGMFPYYQQQSYNNPGRIYVNPHFKGQQQMPQMPQIPMMGGYSQPKETGEELLERQRREAAESLRRRQANKQQESGTKRKHSDSSTNDPKRHHTDALINEQARKQLNAPLSESNHTKHVPSSGGFSIRGAAKAKATLQERQREEDRKPSLQDRLGVIRKEDDRKPRESYKSPIAARLQRREESSPISKKVENGKSSELLISNLDKNTTFDSIKKLVDDIGYVAQITYKKGESTSTILFESIDAAVAFRRKYNRSKVDDSHVTITFKK